MVTTCKKCRCGRRECQGNRGPGSTEREGRLSAVPGRFCLQGGGPEIELDSTRGGRSWRSGALWIEMKTCYPVWSGNLLGCGYEMAGNLACSAALSSHPRLLTLTGKKRNQPEPRLEMFVAQPLQILGGLGILGWNNQHVVPTPEPPGGIDLKKGDRRCRNSSPLRWNE